MIRAILFDFNGVLVDDEPLHLELFQKVLEEEGMSLDAGDYHDHCLGFDDRDCFSAVFAASGQTLDPARSQRLIARKATYYQQRIRQQGFPFFPGVERLMGEVVASELMLGVVSGALKAEVEVALEQLGVRHAFKTVVVAEDVSSGKPDPEGYLLGLRYLNSHPPLPSRLFHPHEVLAIEDSPAGLSAAAAAGLSTLGVAQTYPLADLVAADHRRESIAGVDLGELHRLFDV